MHVILCVEQDLSSNTLRFRGRYIREQRQSFIGTATVCNNSDKDIDLYTSTQTLSKNIPSVKMKVFNTNLQTLCLVLIISNN